MTGPRKSLRYSALAAIFVVLLGALAAPTAATAKKKKSATAGISGPKSAIDLAVRAFHIAERADREARALANGAAHLAAGAVQAVNIAAGAVGTGQLADGGVTGSKIAPGAVGTGQLADGSVTGSKIAGGAVGAAQLAAGAVQAANIAAGAVGQAQLASGAVGTSQLQSKAVGTGQIADHAVTSTQIALATILEQRFGHAARRVAPAQPAGRLGPGGADTDPVFFALEIDLGAGLQAQLVSHFLRDHDLSLCTDALSHTRSITAPWVAAFSAPGAQVSA